MNHPWDTLPKPFVERLSLMISKENLKPILQAFNTTRPTTFRINTLKTTKKDVEQILSVQEFEFKEVDWYPYAYILQNRTLRDLTETSLYKEGNIYVQSLSSMIPVLILDPKPNEHILDLCAAPGSKTTQIAMMMENSGTLVASDNSQIRVYKLKANLAMQHVTNTTVITGSGQILWQKYPEYFDKTLVDVPCSMEGRFDCRDPKTYEHWSTKKVKELAERQKWLLRSAISATKPGGTIVYSTCTLSPEENEGVTDWILHKEKGKVMLEHVTLLPYVFDPSISSWNGKTYETDETKTKRIYPTPYMEGFFIAKFKKITSTIPRILTQ